MCILQNMQNLPKEPMRADINVPDPQNRRTSQKLMPSLGIRAKGVPPQDKLKLPQPNQLLQGDCKRLCCFGASGRQGASICLRAPSWRPRLTSNHAGRPVRLYASHTSTHPRNIGAALDRCSHKKKSVIPKTLWSKTLTISPVTLRWTQPSRSMIQASLPLPSSRRASRACWAGLPGRGRSRASPAPALVSRPGGQAR